MKEIIQGKDLKLQHALLKRLIYIYESRDREEKKSEGLVT